MFCPKVPQAISHDNPLDKAGDLTTAFLQGIRAFGKHLGPVFLQLSERYAPGRRNALYAFLASWPTDVQLFLELRHPDWFTDAVIRKELFDALRERNTGAVITDTAGRRDVCHMELAVPKAFVRFVANSLHPTDYTRIDRWVERIRYWLLNGLQEIYFIVHMPNEAFSPELTVYLVDKLNAACGLSLSKPAFIQGNLF